MNGAFPLYPRPRIAGAACAALLSGGLIAGIAAPAAATLAPEEELPDQQEAETAPAPDDVQGADEDDDQGDDQSDDQRQDDEGREEQRSPGETAPPEETTPPEETEEPDDEDDGDEDDEDEDDGAPEEDPEEPFTVTCPSGTGVVGDPVIITCQGTGSEIASLSASAGNQGAEISADGTSITYLLSSHQGNSGTVQDSFTVTATSSDGDAATAPVTVTLTVPSEDTTPPDDGDDDGTGSPDPTTPPPGTEPPPESPTAPGSPTETSSPDTPGDPGAPGSPSITAPGAPSVPGTPQTPSAPEETSGAGPLPPSVPGAPGSILAPEPENQESGPTGHPLLPGTPGFALPGVPGLVGEAFGASPSPSSEAAEEGDPEATEGLADTGLRTASTIGALMLAVTALSIGLLSLLQSRAAR